MKKLRPKSNVVLAVMVFGISLFLWNRQKEDITEAIEIGYQTVSIKEAIDHFKTIESLAQNQANDLMSV